MLVCNICVLPVLICRSVFAETLETAVQNVKTWRDASEFWNEWTLCKDVKEFEGKFSDEIVMKELKKASTLEELVDAVEDEWKNLLDIQAIKKR